MSVTEPNSAAETVNVVSLEREKKAWSVFTFRMVKAVVYRGLVEIYIASFGYETRTYQSFGRVEIGVWIGGCALVW
jgi:hypothetical protein